MSIQRPQVLKGALSVTSADVYVPDEHAVSHIVYGIVVGLVATGMSWDEACGYVRSHLPADARWQRIPNEYRKMMGFTGATVRLEDMDDRTNLAGG